MNALHSTGHKTDLRCTTRMSSVGRLCNSFGTLVKLLALFGLLTSVCQAQHTYYIGLNGSDSNTTTQAQSQSTPWLHAPGMTGATGVPSSYTPVAGDKLIFRGGDTWHYNSGVGTPVGLPWSWSWSGSSSSCQLSPSAGTVVKTSCIYIGVDPSFFTGGSWTRPKFSLDNTINNTQPASCSFLDDSVNALNLGSQNYLIVDNLEFSGACYTNPSAAYMSAQGQMIEFSNNYFHGWMITNPNTGDDYHGLGGGMPKANYVRCDHNVFDNSDGSLGNLANLANQEAVGYGINQQCKEIDHSVWSQIANGFVANPSSVHDNLFQFMYDPGRAPGCTPPNCTHGNISEWDFSAAVTGTLYFYNNVMHDTNEGEGVDTESGGVDVWIFNNVSWLYRAGVDGANCYLLVTDAGKTSTVHFFNDTNVSTCSARNTSTGATTFQTQNTHMIGYAGSTMSTMVIGSNITLSDLGNNIFQSAATATTQGYVAGNAYAPTSGTNSTVGAGANVTSSQCGAIADAGAAAACLNGIGGVTYNATNHTAVDNTPIARPSSGAWDTGAYEFNSGTVAPPTFSPVAGTYLTTQTVSLSTTTSGATICFTTDGTIPTESGNVCLGGTTQTYSTALTVSSNQTIKALGTKSGLTDSSIASATYVIGIVPVAPSLLMLQFD